VQIARVTEVLRELRKYTEVMKKKNGIKITNAKKNACLRARAEYILIYCIYSKIFF